MRSVSLLALLAFAPILSAQTTTTRPAVLLGSQENNCPIGFSARHAGAGGLVATDRNAKPHANAYRLDFRPRDARFVAHARLTFLGLNGAHIIPAAGQALPQQRQTFNVTPNTKDKDLFQTIVYTDELTAVQFIQLDELTFTDGTQWHASAGTPCRITPNGFTLVTATNP